MIGVVDSSQLASAVFHSRSHLLACEGEVGAKLRLVGEGARTGGTGSVVGAYSSYFELEVGNDRELGIRAVDTKAEQAAEDLVAVDRGIGAVFDDEAGVDTKMDGTG